MLQPPSSFSYLFSFMDFPFIFVLVYPGPRPSGKRPTSACWPTWRRTRDTRGRSPHSITLTSGCEQRMVEGNIFFLARFTLSLSFTQFKSPKSAYKPVSKRVIKTFRLDAFCAHVASLFIFTQRSIYIFLFQDLSAIVVHVSIISTWSLILYHYWLLTPEYST